MGYKETYEAWLEGAYFDEATKAELQAIKTMTRKLRIVSIKILSLVQQDYVG